MIENVTYVFWLAKSFSQSHFNVILKTVQIPTIFLSINHWYVINVINVDAGNM